MLLYFVLALGTFRLFAGAWTRRPSARFQAASRYYDAAMTKVRTTVTLDEGVLRWVKVRAARQGKGDSQVIEESLRRDLGLELLERLWQKSRMSEDAAMRLALEAQHRTRPHRSK